MVWRTCAIALAMLAAAVPARAQPPQPADRADPAVIEQELDVEQRQPEPRSDGQVSATDRASVGTQDIEIVAGAVRVEGAVVIPAAAFAPAIEPFLGQPLDRVGLARLAGAVAQVARNRGYGLATAWVPPQDIDRGILVVRIDEGRIDAVQADGPAARVVEARLAGIAHGRPVSTAELERALLLAGDVPGLWVGNAELIRNGRNLLRVRARYDRVAGRLWLDNWGSNTIGPVRARAMIEANGVATFGDRLTLGGLITPIDPSELQFVDLGYRVPLGRGGTEVGLQAYLGWTDSLDFSGRELEGDSGEIEVEISHPLQRSRDDSVWLSGRFTVRDSELVRPGRILRDDRIVTASAMLSNSARLLGGRLRGRFTLTRGLDLLNATVRGDPNASRLDAGGEFTRLDYWADYYRSLGGGFAVHFATEGQIADRPLLASEEMGLGGRRFLRAFDYREMSGDEGAAVSAELQFNLSDLPRAFRNVQFYAYADAGRVTNRQGGFGGGDLASAGGGVRTTLRSGIDAGVEFGIPLTDGAFNSDPTPRFSFTIGARF